MKYRRYFESKELKHKKYNIDSTPTILINEKKYNGKVDYEQFKEIQKRF